MLLEEWLDDLCVRFIINLPPEELDSVERICFQVEEAQWFYEDFIRPLDPSLPSLPLRAFSLRIFQHCPLFSEWSADNYTAAFAEFLAYKSRVPVRGAIMLNEEMDQVVLVKGWKKGANWSFPRGKINKHEDDLDCAIREVYEETGFDIKGAGLVKEPKDIKYIEVTMREQHMRLYVFRGVPMEAHFEPRTRKEISRIEWYKLHDLPTLKKSRQQEGLGEQVANTNKFYMVAPFLVPLKKWISQQRKQESRVSSQGFGVNPSVTEESLINHEIDVVNGVDSHENVPSDLPEVSLPGASALLDPSLHLKQLLQIDEAHAVGHEPLAANRHVDAAKSSALLALLRKGSQPDVPATSKPTKPFDQMSIPPDAPKSPHHHHLGSPQLPTLPPPPQFLLPHFGARPETHTPPIQLEAQPQELHPVSPFATTGRDLSSHQGPAPYQRTGDPEFSESRIGLSQGARIPPASALPPLTGHARALLDVFNSAPPLHQSSEALALSPTHKPFYTASLPALNPSSATMPAPVPTISSSLLPTLLARQTKAQRLAQANLEDAADDHRASLLGLFKRPPPAEMAPSGSTPRLPLAPVELAASSSPNGRKGEAQQKQGLVRLLQQRSSMPTQTATQSGSGSRAGQTSATISGPLNQPQFEGIARSSRRSSLSTGPARSPAPKHRTLFDPNQGVQKKILARPVGADLSPARSPKPPEMQHSTSPQRPKSRKDNEAKPFQPQILRRPAADRIGPSREVTTPLLLSQPVGTLKTRIPTRTTSPPRSTPRQSVVDGNQPANEAHKQTLLSLFNASMSSPFPVGQTLAHSPPSVATPTVMPLSSPPPPAAGPETVSPLTDKNLSSRSRLGSLTSIVSSGSQTRAVGEKRQTAAGDKAFLLGYLGRIANSQEG